MATNKVLEWSKGKTGGKLHEKLLAAPKGKVYHSHTDLKGDESLREQSKDEKTLSAKAGHREELRSFKKWVLLL